MKLYYIKKIIRFLTVFTFFSHSIIAQNLRKIDDDLDFPNMKGDIKFIKEIVTDSLGKKKRIFKYYYQNNLLVEKSYHFFIGETLINKKIFTYDNNKNITEIKKLNSDDEKDSLNSSVKYKYNNKNQLQFIYYKNGSTEYVYDDDSFIVEEVYKSNNGKVYKSISFQKSNNDLISQQYIYDENIKSLIQTILYSFTINNQISTLQIYPIKNVLNTQYFKYDKYDNLVETNLIGHPTRVTKYQYQYDKTGNWIEKIVIKYGKIFTIHRRTIEYY